MAERRRSTITQPSLSENADMSVLIARTALLLAGFALWALTSSFPTLDGVRTVREGWDNPLYWQIGLPLLSIVQLLVAMRSSEPIVRAPLWVLAGHAGAMILIHPPGMSLSLLPLTIAFVALPLYLMLFVAASIGRVVRRLTAPL
jgi:hypothetical protein